MDRQEISAQIDLARTANVKKDEGNKLLGRQDHVYKHGLTGLHLVKDDYGVDIIYDATFADMRMVEIELLKICSFYINKIEPILDKDMKNIFPTVDRLKILDEILEYENEFAE